MNKAPEFLFGKKAELKQIIVIYHYDGEDVDVMDVQAYSVEHAIDLAHEELAQISERDGGNHEYYLDLLIDPETCQIIDRL